MQFRQEKAVLGKEAKLHNQTILPMPLLLYTTQIWPIHIGLKLPLHFYGSHICIMICKHYIMWAIIET